MRPVTTKQYVIIGIFLIGSIAAGCAGEPPFQRGSAGESCRARNDCELGLACISGKCIPNPTDLSVTGKACYRVECGGDSECCADFVPASGCNAYERACQANPADCGAYYSLCRCNRVCRNELCMEAGPGCTVDANCSASASPYCVQGRCVACREHGDCRSGNQRCVNGTCQAQCRTNENCPPLHACQAGACVPSGCGSDRECVFVLGNARGRCAAGSCFVGCAADVECNASAFEVCHEGRCTFAGCTNDAECRAWLDLSDTQDRIRAVCR